MVRRVWVRESAGSIALPRDELEGSLLWLWQQYCKSTGTGLVVLMMVFALWQTPITSAYPPFGPTV